MGTSEKLLAAVIDSLCDCREKLQITLPALFNLHETVDQVNAPQPSAKASVIYVRSSVDTPLISFSEKRSLLVQHMVISVSFIFVFFIVT